MANLLHMDPLNELSAYREAIRQLIDAGWVGAPICCRLLWHRWWFQWT